MLISRCIIILVHVGHRTLQAEEHKLKIACFISLMLWQTQLAGRCVISVTLSMRAPTACSAEMDITTLTVSVLNATATGTPIREASPGSVTQTPDTAWTAATTPPGVTARSAPLVSLGTPLPETAQPSVSLQGFKKSYIPMLSNPQQQPLSACTKAKKKKCPR